MVIEWLPLVLDDFLDVSLFLVIDLNFLDAVVGAKVALKVMTKKLNKFLHLFPIIL